MRNAANDGSEPKALIVGDAANDGSVITNLICGVNATLETLSHNFHKFAIKLVELFPSKRELSFR